MASDTITLLGGDCCRPSAVRSKRQHHHDAHKAGHHDDDGRRDGQHRDQRHDLQHAVGEKAAAVQVDGKAAIGGVRWRLAGGGRGRLAWAMRSGAAKAACGSGERQQQQKGQQALEPGSRRARALAVMPLSITEAPSGRDSTRCSTLSRRTMNRRWRGPTISVSTTARRLIAGGFGDAGHAEAARQTGRRRRPWPAPAAGRRNSEEDR